MTQSTFNKTLLDNRISQITDTITLVPVPLGDRITTVTHQIHSQRKHKLGINIHQHKQSWLPIHHAQFLPSSTYVKYSDNVFEHTSTHQKFRRHLLSLPYQLLHCLQFIMSLGPTKLQQYLDTAKHSILCPNIVQKSLLLYRFYFLEKLRHIQSLYPGITNLTVL